MDYPNIKIMLQDFQNTITGEKISHTKLVKHLSDFNMLFIKTIILKQPKYKESLYNMVNNLDEQLRFYNVSPHTRITLIDMYLNILSNMDF